MAYFFPCKCAWPHSNCFFSWGLAAVFQIFPNAWFLFLGSHLMRNGLSMVRFACWFLVFVRWGVHFDLFFAFTRWSVEFCWGEKTGAYQVFFSRFVVWSGASSRNLAGDFQENGRNWRVLVQSIRNIGLLVFIMGTHLFFLNWRKIWLARLILHFFWLVREKRRQSELWWSNVDFGPKLRRENIDFVYFQLRAFFLIGNNHEALTLEHSVNEISWGLSRSD